jgi:glucokinase
VSSLSQIDSATITAHDVATAARRHDPLAVDVLQNAGRLLGFGVANLVSLFDPQVVILSGGMADAAGLYLEPLREAMLERAQPIAAQRVKVVVSKIGGKANLLGCARLAWTSLQPPDKMR